MTQTEVLRAYNTCLARGISRADPPVSEQPGTRRGRAECSPGFADTRSSSSGSTRGPTRRAAPEGTRPGPPLDRPRDPTRRTHLTSPPATNGSKRATSSACLSQPPPPTRSSTQSPPLHTTGRLTRPSQALTNGEGVGTAGSFFARVAAPRAACAVARLTRCRGCRLPRSGRRPRREARGAGASRVARPSGNRRPCLRCASGCGLDEPSCRDAGEEAAAGLARTDEHDQRSGVPDGQACGRDDGDGRPAVCAGGLFGAVVDPAVGRPSS